MNQKHTIPPNLLIECSMSFGHCPKMSRKRHRYVTANGTIRDIVKKGEK